MNDVFESKMEWFKGNPILEILKNGEPFWEGLPSAKEHFSFGRSKALLLLSCLDTIKKFADTDGDLPGPGKITVHSNIETFDDCEVPYHDGFKKLGSWVDLPYLEMSSGGSSIGIGRSKAQAVVELEADIHDFVSKTKGI